MAGFAAGFFQKPDAFDTHAALDRLHHVIDGQAGDRRRRQRLHLDAGRPRHLHGRGHVNARQRGIGLEFDETLRQRQRMTERDQFMRALCRHDAGDARGAEYVALLCIAGHDEIERRFDITMRPSANATRSVAALSDTSTMRASPAGPRWVSERRLGH